MNYIIIFILLLLIYIYSYYNYPKKVAVLQTFPDQFKSDMLLERQPIVIQNNISTLNDLKTVFFKWVPTLNFNISGSDIWHYNKYKYVAIQFEKDGEILLAPPNTKILKEEDAPDPESANLLAIQAKKMEIVIIPFHWRYLIQNKLDVECLGIHDYITYFLP
jgi:hypothetical protein